MTQAKNLNNFSYGTYYILGTGTKEYEDSHRKALKNYILEYQKLEHNRRITYTPYVSHMGCFAGFLGLTRPHPGDNSNYFYWAFPLMVPWWQQLADEINSNITNFHINAEEIGEIFVTEKESGYGNTSTYIEYEATPNNVRTSGALLNVSFNDGYSPDTKRRALYLIHHTFRFLSLSEYCYGKYTDIPKENETFLECILRLNSERLNATRDRSDYRVRCISEQRLYSENWYLLDDLRCALKLSYGTQTSMWNQLKRQEERTLGFPRNFLLRIVTKVRGQKYIGFIEGKNLIIFKDSGDMYTQSKFDPLTSDFAVEKVVNNCDEDINELAKWLFNNTTYDNRKKLKVYTRYPYSNQNLAELVADYRRKNYER